MYEELIKSMRDCATKAGLCKTCPLNIDPSCRDNLMLKAADAIEELMRRCEQFQYMPPPAWIPVTERLPECDLGAEVGNIEWISCGMVHSGCFGRGGKYRDTYFRTWTDAGEGMDAKDADYWRAVTLPEPPKEET